MATHASNPEVTLEDIEKDCAEATAQYHYNNWVFTWVTVRFLLDTIAELKAELETKNGNA